MQIDFRTIYLATPTFLGREITPILHGVIQGKDKVNQAESTSGFSASSQEKLGSNLESLIATYIQTYDARLQKHEEIMRNKQSSLQNLEY